VDRRRGQLLDEVVDLLLRVRDALDDNGLALRRSRLAEAADAPASPQTNKGSREGSISILRSG
jgi:hypothetical protein